MNKLRQTNPRKLWDQVQELEQLEEASKLLPSDVKFLNSLRRDLKDVQRITKWKPPHQAVNADKSPKKSVFYHATINPTGEPPKGYEWHSIDEFDSASTDDSTAEIPLPKAEVGKEISKQPVSKTVYENEPELRLDAKMFVPRSLS